MENRLANISEIPIFQKDTISRRSGRTDGVSGGSAFRMNREHSRTDAHIATYRAKATPYTLISKARGTLTSSRTAVWTAPIAA